MIYHLLTEAEPFSEFRGGAISRWVANVLRDDQDGIVVAPTADESWGFPPARVLIASRLRAYHRLGYRGRRALPRSLRNALLHVALAPVLAKLQPGDLVWVHNRPEIAAALVKSVVRRGAQVVLHMHNSHLMDVAQDVLDALRCVRTVFVSQFLKTEASGRCAQFVAGDVLYNGADERIFFPRKTEPAQSLSVVVLFAGRLVPEKGAHIFASALKILFDQKVPIEGVIVGGTGFGTAQGSDYLRQLAQDAPANLRFEDYRVGPSLGTLFREADIFCVPSIWNEPLSMALLEAMASRLAIVATESGGMVEVLANNEGLLVERNSPVLLAEALKTLVTDRQLRRDMADAAYATFNKRFRWSVARDGYRRISLAAAR